MIEACFITDSNYVLPTLTAILSLRMNKLESNVITVYVLCNNLIASEKRLFFQLKQKNFDIKILDVAEVLPKTSCDHLYVSKASLIKFVIPKLFPKSSKILYLDSDVLILDDLNKLYNIDVSDVYGAVVQDIEATTRECQKRYKLNYYFNSGVMLLNLENMRDDNISDKLIEFKKSDKYNDYMDQNAFNAVFNDKIKLISLQYNYIKNSIYLYTEDYIKDFWNLSQQELNYIRDNVKILHMAGGEKPWLNSLSPYFADYVKYLMSLPNSKLKYDAIILLYKQNRLRFLKYTMKLLPFFKDIIKIYENFI